MATKKLDGRVTSRSVKVFFVNSIRDQGFADRLSHALERRQIRIIPNEDPTPGGLITEHLVSLMLRCDVILVLLSHSALKAHWVNSAISLALNMKSDYGKQLIPIRIEKDVESPFFLRQLQSFDMFDDRTFEKDVARLRTLLLESRGQTRKASQIQQDLFDVGRELDSIRIQAEIELARQKYRYSLMIMRFSLVGLTVALLVVSSFLLFAVRALQLNDLMFAFVILCIGAGMGILSYGAARRISDGSLLKRIRYLERMHRRALIRESPEPLPGEESAGDKAGVEDGR